LNDLGDQLGSTAKYVPEKHWRITLKNLMLRQQTLNKPKEESEKEGKNGMYLCKSAQGAGLARLVMVSPSGFVAICLLLGACSTVPSVFTPKQPIPPGQVTHRLLHDVLHQAVSDGQVDYPRIQRDERFQQYLAQLSRVDPNALPSKTDQLAWWLNAYNAFAIQGILDGETPRPYVGWYRYFKVCEYAAAGTTLNLYDLEHDVLRRRFRDPRVHFAIVCASTSCPRLQAWAYDARLLDRQLDRVAREFINDSRRNRFDRQQKVAALSRIFDWFAEDFVASAGSVQNFVARYVDDSELAKELIQPGYRIEYLEYDWSLNGIPPKEVARAGAF
jgi:Protein of unknown function, DUF547